MAIGIVFSMGHIVDPNTVFLRNYYHYMLIFVILSTSGKVVIAIKDRLRRKLNLKLPTNKIFLN